MTKVSNLKASLARIAKPVSADDTSWITGASDEHLESKRKLFDSAINDFHEQLHDGGELNQDAMRAAIKNKRLVEAEQEKRREKAEAIEQRQKVEQQPAAAPAAPAAPAQTPVASLVARIKALAGVTATPVTATPAGYYFYDSANGEMYPEGGRYNTFAEIQKVDTKSFYQHGNGEAPDEVDDSLVPCYVNEKGQIFTNLHLNQSGGVAGRRLGDNRNSAAAPLTAMSQDSVRLIGQLNQLDTGVQSFLQSMGGTAPEEAQTVATFQSALAGIKKMIIRKGSGSPQKLSPPNGQDG